MVPIPLQLFCPSFSLTLGGQWVIAVFLHWTTDALLPQWQGRVPDPSPLTCLPTCMRAVEEVRISTCPAIHLSFFLTLCVGGATGLVLASTECCHLHGDAHGFCSSSEPSSFRRIGKSRLYQDVWSCLASLPSLLLLWVSLMNAIGYTCAKAVHELHMYMIYITCSPESQ